MRFTKVEKTISELILETPSPGKHAARNAIHHLELAFVLEKIDKEMAAFRAITAEEEAATALMQAFRQRKYPGAKKLDHRNHVHKSAVFPFLIVLSQRLDKFKKEGGMSFVSQLMNKKGKRKFRLLMRLPYEKDLVIDPPLEITLITNGAWYDLKEDIQHFVIEQKTKEIIDLVRKRAHFRNQILYADSHGIPELRGLGKTLTNARVRVFHILSAYLLVAPFGIQDGGKQLLYCYLKMLKLIPSDIKFL